MLAATKVKISGSEKKCLTGARCSRAKQRQGNVQKSVQHVQSCFLGG